MVKRIVVGVDGSPGSARGLRWAIGLAQHEEAEIVAVYALGPVEDLARGASNAVAAGLGLPPSEAGSWRDRESADLIVVGSHGHGNFEGRVLGGVSYKVSHRAHQPVVIVPPEAA